MADDIDLVAPLGRSIKDMEVQAHNVYLSTSTMRKNGYMTSRKDLDQLAGYCQKLGEAVCMFQQERLKEMGLMSDQYATRQKEGAKD